MLHSSMSQVGWNATGVGVGQGWEVHSFGQPQIPRERPAPAPMKLGAIGSERRVNATGSPVSSTSSADNNKRPPSWQDEVGLVKPRSPRDLLGPLPAPTFEADNSNSRVVPGRIQTRLHSAQPFVKQGRSSSTPADEAIKPSSFPNNSRLRHLSMSASGQLAADQEHRSRLRLSRPPTEFVPSNRRSEVTTNDETAVETPAADMDGAFMGQYSYFNPFSPVPGEKQQRDAITESLKIWPREPRREVNLREIKEMPMPRPRPGSPDIYSDDPEQLAARVSAWNLTPTMGPHEPVELPQHMQALIETGGVETMRREYMLKLLNAPLPPSQEVARSMGYSPKDYCLMQMRDRVRLSIPNSTFPFFNGMEIDHCISNYPLEIQKAYYNPPPAHSHNQYVVVTFKHHRADVFIAPGKLIFGDQLSIGNMVVVQADRGENVGQVWHICSNMMEAEKVARDLNTEQLNNLLGFARKYNLQHITGSTLSSSFKITSQPQEVVRKAENRYMNELMRKEHDETKAKRIAAQKADDMGFPLEILDTEFQIDHQKLTIYYISDQYVRFKELVNNIYKIYKMRIWMSSINPLHPHGDYQFEGP